VAIDQTRKALQANLQSRAAAGRQFSRHDDPGTPAQKPAIAGGISASDWRIVAALALIAMKFTK